MENRQNKPEELLESSRDSHPANWMMICSLLGSAEAPWGLFTMEMRLTEVFLDSLS